MKLILFLENHSVLILETYYNDQQYFIINDCMLSSYLLIHSRLGKAQAVTCTCLLYRKANRLVNSGAFHHGERFANQHLISSIFSPSQLIIAAPHNCFFLYEGRRKIFAQSNHPIVCNFQSGEFLPLTNKKKRLVLLSE